ncbi:MAG: BrnT family toxin [Gemmatimonadota bacterium]|nr:BrnT family toxin [Gemmatimonadota bacterium]MDH5197890.1 BrnT family toxin [Gemmatimonadota bacterium]
MGPAKRFANLAKHGVDFVGAARVFAGPIFEIPDRRRDYRELRVVAVGEHAGQLLTAVYTWRGPTRRLISARRSNRREQQAYEAALAGAARPDGLGTPPPADG